MERSRLSAKFPAADDEVSPSFLPFLLASKKASEGCRDFLARSEWERERSNGWKVGTWKEGGLLRKPICRCVRPPASVAVIFRILPLLRLLSALLLDRVSRPSSLEIFIRSLFLPLFLLFKQLPAAEEAASRAAADASQALAVSRGR